MCFIAESGPDSDSGEEVGSGSEEEDEDEEDDEEEISEDEENKKPFDFIGVEEELQQISETNLESPHPKPLSNPLNKLLHGDEDEYDKDSSDEEVKNRVLIIS